MFLFVGGLGGGMGVVNYTAYGHAFKFVIGV